MLKNWMLTVGLILAGLAASTTVTSQAEPMDGYTLIGEDPAGDFGYKLAEQDDPAGTFGEGKIDIVRLDAGLDGETLNLRMSLPGTTMYRGSGNHMWTVQFDVDGTPFDACWTIITGGTSTTGATDVEENTRGCSMFPEADVGPRTRADGVKVEAYEEEGWFIEWPVAVESVGGVGVTLENIVAKTWARTGDTDDGPPEYQFDLHDVAPNEGVWTYVVGTAGVEEPAFALDLTASKDNVSVDAGSKAQFSLTLGVSGNATGAANISVVGLPEDFAVDAPASIDLNGTGNQSFDVVVTAPESAANTTHVFTVAASAPGNVTGNVTLTLNVGPPVVTLGDGFGGNATDNGTAMEATDGAGLPSVGAFVTLGVLAAAVALAWRRRGTNL